MAQHQLGCEHRIVACDVCKTSLKVTEVRTHACLSTMQSRIVTLEQTVADLQKQLGTNKSEQDSLRMLVNELLGGAPGSAGSASRFPRSIKPVPLGVPSLEKRLAEQREKQCRHPR